MDGKSVLKVAWLSARKCPSFFLLVQADTSALTSGAGNCCNSGRSEQLKWSYDDALIAAATDAGILLINTETGIVIQNPGSPVTPYGVGWNSANTLHFSRFEQNRWQAYEFDPIANQVTALSENIAFLITNGKNLYHFDHQMNLFDEAGHQIKTTDCAAPIVRLTLSYQLWENSIYCLAKDQAHIIQFNRDKVIRRIALPETSGTYYSPSKNGVAVSVLTTANSDIMRTNFAQ